MYMSHQNIRNHQVLKNLQAYSKPMKMASQFWTWPEADLAGWDLRACLDHKWLDLTQEPIWGKLSNLMFSSVLHWLYKKNKQSRMGSVKVENSKKYD